MDWTAWSEIAKGYGLGVATLGFLVWYLMQEIKEKKLKEEKLQLSLLGLTKETLLSINGMSKIVDRLAPTISNLSVSNKADLDKYTRELKEHITHVAQRIEDILMSRTK